MLELTLCNKVRGEKLTRLLQAACQEILRRLRNQLLHHRVHNILQLAYVPRQINPICRDPLHYSVIYVQVFPNGIFPSDFQIKSFVRASYLPHARNMPCHFIILQSVY
jgi:hypothetical protein